jgi:hypothetical protein
MWIDREAEHKAYMRRLDIEGRLMGVAAVLGVAIGLHATWMLLTRCICH